MEFGFPVVQDISLFPELPRASVSVLHNDRRIINDYSRIF